MTKNYRRDLTAYHWVLSSGRNGQRRCASLDRAGQRIHRYKHATPLRPIERAGKQSNGVPLRLQPTVHVAEYQFMLDLEGKQRRLAVTIALVVRKIIGVHRPGSARLHRDNQGQL